MGSDPGEPSSPNPSHAIDRPVGSGSRREASKTNTTSSAELLDADLTPAFVTKILLPRRRADVLSRPRLLEFLNQHLDRKLLLVCAPPGYGKTTLLVDFAHQTSVPVCWYSLAPSDADPQVFLEYLVAAIRRRVPSFGDRTLRYLRSAGAKDLEVIAGLFVSDLHAAAETCLVIVLDDVHHVDSQAPIQTLLNLIIPNLPSTCCWILASRTIPRVRLSRLVANREAAGLGETDLRFTATEIQHLFSRHFRLLIPDALAEELARDAEGWIAGIILTSHSLWQGLFKGIIRTKRSGGPVFDYLAAEVFDHQDPDLKDFLVGSSVLARLSPERCDALLDRRDSATVLRTLEEENLFLFRFEGEEDWYRYHLLFQDFLQARLRRDDPARFQRLQQRAGELAEADGDVNGALEHYLQAGDVERAASLLERVADSVLASGRAQTLLQWCARFPPEVLANRPRLQIARARASFDAGDLAQSQQALDAAWEASQRLGDRVLLATTLLWRSQARRIEGRFPNAIADCRSGLQLAEEIGNSELLALGNRLLGLTLVAAGSSGEAIPALERALAAYATLDDHHNQGIVNHTLGIIWKRQGEMIRARAALDRATEHWRRIRNEGMLAGTLVVLGNLHYELGQSAEALAVLSDAQRAAHESGYLRLEGYAAQSLGEVLRDRAEFAAGRSAYEHSLLIAEKVSDDTLQIAALVGLARCHLYAGEVGLAHATVGRARHLACERESAYERAICDDAYGLICLETGQIEQGIAALEQACAGLATGGGVRDLARARLHLARARLQTGRRDDAIELAHSALTLLPAGANDPLLSIEATRLADVLRAVESEGPPWLAELTSRLSPPPVELAKPSIVALPKGQDVHTIRCYTLGRADLELDGRMVAVGEWQTLKARELWFYLLAHGPVSRSQLLEALWPETGAVRGLSALHTTVHRVRRTLFANCLERNGDLWGIAAGLRVWTDDREFEALATQVGGSSPRDLVGERRELAAKAIALYRGLYLESLDALWLINRRRRLEGLYLRLLRALLEQAREERRYEEVVAYAERYLQTDPDDETIHEALMRSYVLLGNRTAALRHYQRYAEQLRHDLATQPSRRLRLLSEQIARES